MDKVQRVFALAMYKLDLRRDRFLSPRFSSVLPPSANPARLSPLLASVFPPGVVGAELRMPGNASLLLPDEVQSLGPAVPLRIREFAAGRTCARRALEEFGITGHSLRMQNDRLPHWPASMTGSISHSAVLRGAVVARQRQFRALGLDIEITAQVTREIWPAICSPQEMQWLAALEQPQRERYAALIFSAKEAFYKCQYCVTGQWLEFDDVEVDLLPRIAHAGCFVVRPRRRIALLDHIAMPLLGRFVFDGNLLVAGMAIAAC